MSGHTGYPIKAEAVSDPISHKCGEECWIFITFIFWIETSRYIWRLYNLRNNLIYPAHGKTKLGLPVPTTTSCPEQTMHSSHCLLHLLCSTELSSKIKAIRKQNWIKLMRMQIMPFVIRSLSSHFIPCSIIFFPAFVSPPYPSFGFFFFNPLLNSE